MPDRSPSSPSSPSQRPRGSRLGRAARTLSHVVFDQSREGRAGEIAAWSNAASALAVAGGVVALTWSRFSVHAAWIGLACGVFAFVALRFALAHRVTVWLAAIAGTLTVSAVGGGLAWLFAHVLERAAAPSIAAIGGALVAALAPAWSYAQLVRRRADHVRDSLVDPPSMPMSG